MGRRQVVIAGPLGTSNTWVASLVARYVTGDEPSKVRLVQFHSSYTYEQFIEGLRPRVADNGAIEFARVDGIVLDVVPTMAHPDDLTIIVIDEMNRANLSKVFGELMYLFLGRGSDPRLGHVVLHTAGRRDRRCDDGVCVGHDGVCVGDAGGVSHVWS